MPTKIKTNPVTIHAHITNLRPIEQQLLHRIIQILTDPKDKLTRVGLITGQLTIRITPSSKLHPPRVQFIPTGHN